MLYFSAGLRSADLPVCGDPPPEVLWSRLAGDGGLTAVWLLTPDTHARTWWQCCRLEDRWAAGNYDQARMEEVWRRWAKIDAWALECFGEAGLLAARARLEAADGPKGRLPDPPPLRDAAGVAFGQAEDDAYRAAEAVAEHNRRSSERAKRKEKAARRAHEAKVSRQPDLIRKEALEEGI